MSITQNNIESGKKFVLDKLAKTWVKWVRLTLDSSYPSGGYGSTQGFSPGAFGFKEIRGVSVVGHNAAASMVSEIKYDYANKKLLAIRAADAVANLIVEESVTVSSNAGRLANVPAYILSVHQSTGGTTGAAKVVPTGSTLGTLQCGVNFLTGALAFFATDAVTVAKVTYIPLGVGPFIEANRVIDEAVTLGNGAAVNLANRAALVQYVYNTNGSNAANKAMALIGQTNAPGANQAYINLNNSSNTSILDNAAQNTNVASVTYWKYTPFVAYGATANASSNATSNAIKYTSVNTVPGILIPAYGVQHAAYATNTDVPSVALGPSGAVAANTPVYDPAKNQISFLSGDSITREEYGYIVLNASQLGAAGPASGQAEVPTGSNLSTVTVDLRIEGRPL